MNLKHLSINDIYDNTILEKVNRIIYLRENKLFVYHSDVVFYSVNYAISVMHGTSKTFEEWYSSIEFKSKTSFERCIDELCDRGSKSSSLVGQSYESIQILIECIDDYIMKLEKRQKMGIVDYVDFVNIANTYTHESLLNPDITFLKWFNIYDRQRKILSLKKIITKNGKGEKR